MNIQKKKVNELKAAEYNPREITEADFEQLKQSIQEFDYIEPVIWNKQLNRIVGGHMRVRALLDLGRGAEEIDVVVVDLPEDKERELNIRLNANQGKWDWDLVANNFDLNELKTWGLEMPNIDMETFDAYKEWEGMPEFDNENQKSFRRIVVHFDDNEAVQDFAKRLGQQITDETRSIWHPKKERAILKDMEYKNES